MNTPRAAVVAMIFAMAVYLIAAWMMFGGQDHWLGSRSYTRIAANLVHGSDYTSDGIHATAQRPPVYPLILMSTMDIAGENWFVATILLQAFATVACLLLVFRIAGQLWPGSRAPWLAVGLLILHAPFMIEMIALRETVWFTLGLLGIAWLLLREAKSLMGAIAMGFCLAGIYLLRPTGLLVAIVTIPFLAAAAWRTRGSRNLIAAVLSASVLVIPWQVYTWRAFGAPGFFPSSLVGYNLCKGALPDIASVYPWIDADTLDLRMRRLAASIPVGDEHAVDARFTKIARTVIRAAPGAALRRMVLNTLVFVSPLPTPLGSGTLIESAQGLGIGGFQLDWKAIFFTPLIFLILVAGACGVVAMAGSVGGARRYGLWMAALFSVFLAVHALTFVKTRYRLPLDGLLAIPAGGWLARFNPWWLQNLIARIRGQD